MGEKKRIAVIPGDGIGKEVTPQAVRVIQAVGAAVELTSFDWGADRYLADKTTVPPDGFTMLARDFDAILVGAFGDPRVPSNIHAKEILLGMRFKMDLYANVRPARLMDASLCPLKGVEPKDVDFVVIRENTEGVYGDLGGVFKQGTPDEIAIQEDVNTRKGVERIIRYAFEYCANHRKLDGAPRQRVLMCDKSNAMTHAGGLWQRVFKEVAAEHPKIETQHVYVDALCMQMVRDPRPFDVVVTNNMFGDIITDLAAGLQGGLGMAASGNLHPGRTSMFEPVHGSAPAIAGKNIANPFGAILTAAMMLAHLGMKAEAEKIETAVLEAVRQKKTTQDLGGTLGTREAGEWVAERVTNELKVRKFKAYVGDPDFHDGVIERVQQDATEITVEISGYSGARYIVRFTGVECFESRNPEGMVLYALAESEADLPLRDFYFANSRDPDEEGGDSRLVISARAFSVEKM
ncbi:MAG TPA: 3-isopropylmalate dehydrogenase [Terriglobales bacterium]